jgi:aspartyl-tRNA synthetase
MDRFGTDKPDVRFGLELRDVGEIVKRSQFQVFLRVLNSGGIVKGLNLKGCADLSRTEIEDLQAQAAIHGAQGMAWMKATEKGLESNIVKFFPDGVQDDLRKKLEAEPGDLLVFVADLPEVTNPALSSVRNLMGKRLGLYDPKDFGFVWVTEFPLFEKDEQGRPTPCHHPFTSPLEEDISILESDPFKVRSAAYDLALNGYEIAGGSIRIHRPDVQARIFRILGISDEEAEDRFGFLVNAFRYGAPPHGGVAFGFDRLIMILCGTDNIRDVIAFPKTQRAQSVMEGSPSTVKEEQLRELGIRLRK